jgi:hypothetical protein
MNILRYYIQYINHGHRSRQHRLFSNGQLSIG